MDNYKPACLEAIRASVEPGDHVVDIAGGRGVFVTVAAQKGAEVTSYEGSIERVGLCRETARLSNVADRVSIVHAIVGTAHVIDGQADDAEVISPADLPDCDVLLLDAEGAEIDILEGMKIHPRRIVVETHPGLGSDTERVRTILEEKGYEVLAVGEVDPDAAVLTAAPAER